MSYPSVQLRTRSSTRDVFPETPMRKLDTVEFLREVLAQLDELPEGFEQKLIEAAASSPTTRSARIRRLIEEATRG